MPNAFNQLLGALSGGFTGAAQEQDKQRVEKRQAQNDLYLNEDRASQRALRDAQATTSAQRAQQDAALRTPEFQSLYQKARSGDEGAIAQVASMVAGHPDAATFMTPLTREPKEVPPLATTKGFVNRDGSPVLGKDGKPLMPVATQGTNVYLPSVGPDGKTVYAVGTSKGTPHITPTDVQKPQAAGGQGQKEQAFVALMNDALPTMERLGSTVRPWAISGALKNPTVGNVVLTDNEREYLTAARGYLAGVLHLESGARLTDSQIQWGQARFLPALGDRPKNIMDKFRSAAQTARDRAAIAHGSAGAMQGPAQDTAPPGQPKTGNIFLDNDD